MKTKANIRKFLFEPARENKTKSTHPHLISKVLQTAIR